MASLALLRRFSRLLPPTRLPSGSSARSKFYVREPLHDKPDWLKVGFALGTSVFMWIYDGGWFGFMKALFFRCHRDKPSVNKLIKQHNEDVLEYKRRNGLE